MLRRNPTRIEHKIDDLEEYDAIKKEMEQKRQRQMETTPEPQQPPRTSSGASRTDQIHTRIGYDPRPLSHSQSSRMPIHWRVTSLTFASFNGRCVLYEWHECSSWMWATNAPRLLDNSHPPSSNSDVGLSWTYDLQTIMLTPEQLEIRERDIHRAKIVKQDQQCVNSCWSVVLLMCVFIGWVFYQLPR